MFFAKGHKILPPPMCVPHASHASSHVILTYFHRVDGASVAPSLTGNTAALLMKTWIVSVLRSASGSCAR